MATYKKRGHKPATKKEKDEALEQQSATAGVFNTLDESASKTEKWVAKNQKHIFTFIGVIALGALIYMGYQQFISAPKEKEAAAELFQAENYFKAAENTTAKDSIYNLALHGGDGKYGFLKIIENYGNTPSGNLAKYYAGMTYMNLNNPQEAINYLKDFKAKEAITGALAKGNIGDAYASLGQKEEALKYFKEAARFKENELTTPMYLLKAAITAIQLDKNKEALTFLNEIKENYPNATEINQTEILIAQVEASIK